MSAKTLLAAALKAVTFDVKSFEYLNIWIILLLQMSDTNLTCSPGGGTLEDLTLAFYLVKKMN